MTTTVPLKSIPVENGDGQPLELCPNCYGAGRFTKAIKEPANGALSLPEVRYVRERDVKALKKQGFTFESGPCGHCKGAGMALASGARHA